MTRKELYYETLLSNLSDVKSEIDTYYAEHQQEIDSNEQRTERLSDFFSTVEILESSINQSSDRVEMISDFDLISDFIDSYESFSNTFSFLDNKLSYFKVWLKFIKHIDNIKPYDLDLEVELNNQNFVIKNLGELLLDNHFLYFESGNLPKSLIIYSGTIINDSFLEDNVHSLHIDLMFIWLHLLSNENITQFPQSALIKLDNDIEMSNLKSILKIKVLLNGKRIKSIVNYTNPPAKPDQYDLDLADNYTQFESVTGILNEYNSQTFILAKYLKLYQIIENFMYKYRVCKLEVEKNGAPFHIRDFRTLYDRFSLNEMECIQEFFNVALRENNGNSTFIQNFRSQWGTLLSTNHSVGEVEINNLFSSLALKSTYTFQNLSNNLDSNMLAIVIYKIRNAIVHNKDSETHFENTNLPIALKFLLESYFIPNLEKLVFHLIINRNNLVWYSHNNILLY